MSTMAEVLAAHTVEYEADGDYGERSWLACKCSVTSFEDDAWTGQTMQDHAEHVADALTKAGYGKLADAWDEGWSAGAGWPQDDDNPYGSASK